MENIKFTSTVKIGDKVIDTINVSPLTFVEFVEIHSTALRAGRKYTVAMQRARIKKQVKFISNGETIPIDDISIGQLPAPVARAIVTGFTVVSEGEVRGKLISEGDGVTTPMLYQLGTPLVMTSGKEGEIVIRELEIMAATYADIEEVLAANNQVNETMEILRNIAAPVGVPGLMRLPGWALDRITVADGFTIMEDVLPRF
jgi:hypothetical protein